MRRYKPDSVRTPYDIADMNFEHICAIGSLSETEKNHYQPSSFTGDKEMKKAGCQGYGIHMIFN